MTDEQQYQWYIFHRDNLLLRRHDDSSLSVPTGAEPPIENRDGGRIHDVTMDSGLRVKAFSVSSQQPDGDGWKWVNLRPSFNYLPVDDYLAAGKAYQILYWDRHSIYCPTCGIRTEWKNPIMKKCPRCGLEMYPPISPAVIVLIRRGEDEILMVHSRNFRGNFYGLVAGFLEAGESLEQCVRREVMEETGLTIKNLRYFGSQTWPYPSGVMVGFTADYDSGTIKIQEDELSAGAFFHRDHLPELPQKMSIARRLIDDWLKGGEKQR